MPDLHRLGLLLGQAGFDMRITKRCQAVRLATFRSGAQIGRTTAWQQKHP
ncbi:hypothetical protein [Paenibacillus graminis]|nr:hypothetical protein [Paenibacillus graminis]MEC0171259.1 hypothetical protein [Paenibacillus graminis]